MSGEERATVAARLATLSDDELAAALGDLGGSLAVPEPADLPDRVSRRLQGSGRAVGVDGVKPARWWRRPGLGTVPLRRALVLAIVAALVLAAVAAALGLGLPGIRITFGPGPLSAPSTVPSPAPSVSAALATAPGNGSPPVASPSGATPGSGLSLGRQVSLDEARSTAGYPVGVPGLAGLGPPDAAWLDTSGAGPVVTMVWGPRAGATSTDGVGLLLSELPARIDTGFFQKFIDSGTQLQPVAVGDAGWWITGALHQVAVVGADGNLRFDTVRLAGNVLLWSSGQVTFRLETSLDLSDALEIAQSVR